MASRDSAQIPQPAGWGSFQVQPTATDEDDGSEYPNRQVGDLSGSAFKKGSPLPPNVACRRRCRQKLKNPQPAGWGIQEVRWSLLQ